MQIELEQLRDLIGINVIYRGNPCSIIEVLEDGPSLVLEDTGTYEALQETQFGTPYRAVPETHTIPVLSETGEFHPEFVALMLKYR
jgi:hypothetical protein